MMNRNEECDELMGFFEYAHLSPELQTISKPFGELATRLYDTLPRSMQLQQGLQHLLAAKDCCVRARLRAKQVADELAEKVE